eukprot:COSAG01_NODE_592_length_15109_cov_39.247435_6_plen_34_part_00
MQLMLTCTKVIGYTLHSTVILVSDGTLVARRLY